MKVAHTNESTASFCRFSGIAATLELQLELFGGVGGSLSLPSRGAISARKSANQS